MLKNSLLARSCVLAFGLVLVVGSVSEAQRRGGFQRGRGISRTALLGSEQVQKELNLTGEQITKVEAISNESRQRVRETFSEFRGLRDLPEDQRDKKREEIREKMAAVAAETSQKIGGVLNESQSKRLDEIVLQQRGIRALSDKEVAGKLNLTGDQQQKIRDLIDTQREMTRELFSGLRGTPRDQLREKMEELNKKREGLRTETDKAVMEVLTAEQKTQYEQLQGAKFELDRRSLFQGRRGGRDGQRGRRGNRDNDRNRDSGDSDN